MPIRKSWRLGKHLLGRAQSGWPAWVRLAALLIVFMNETVWNGALALLLSTGRAPSAFMRAKAGIDRTAGSFMMLFGGRWIWGATRVAVTER